MMMKVLGWRRVFFVALSIAMCPFIHSQNVIVESKIDSVEMYIGSQAKLTLEVTADSDANVAFPEFNDTIVTGLEVVGKSKLDTLFLNEGKRMTIARDYYVTSFDSAFFHIPGLKVLVDGREYLSKDMPLRVYRYPIDNADANDIRDISGIEKPDFVFTDWLPMSSFLLLTVVLVAVAVFLFIRYRDNKPIIKVIHVEPQLLPHEKAEKIIESIKERNLSHSLDPKDYYTSLTEALRVYISGRFGFSAMEMTSSEIVDKLLETNDKESLRQLQSLFTVADLVKFAKYVPMLNENDANLLSAVAFINKTKEEVKESEREKPHDVVIEEPRSKRQKRMLLAFIILAALIGMVFLVLSVREIRIMLF